MERQEWLDELDKLSKQRDAILKQRAELMAKYESLGKEYEGITEQIRAHYDVPYED